MQEKVSEIIIRVLTNNNKYNKDIKISPSARLREDIGFDSFNLAELTVHIEEEFGVDIFEDGIISTVGEIYNKLMDN